MTSRPMPTQRLAYLCLQATREGQASYAHVHEMIRGLERRGWTVDLFEPRYARDAEMPGLLGRALEFLRLQLRCARASANIDVLYVRAHFAAWPASVWGAFRRLRTVQELNGVYADAVVAHPRLRPFRRLIAAAQRSQLRSASLVICVTEGLARWVKGEASHQRVTVIPNGANTELFTPDGPIAQGLPARYVAFIGSLAQWHGVETMLSATSDPGWPAGVALLIAGKGARSEEVRKAAAASDRVVYLGQVPYGDVPAVVRGAMAVLSVQPAIPTTTIGGINPLKVYEALACGVPVIVANHPGQADLVRGEACGWIVPPDDPAAIARAVGEVTDNPNEASARGARGRRAVLREHSWDARAASTHKALLGLLGRHDS